MKISYIVDAAHDGRELRQLVRAPLGLSAKLWKHIKWNGTILVNGKQHGDARLRVHTGDELTLLWQEVLSVVPVDLPLDILYEDETFLVVNKPAGMIVHPTHRAARDTLVHAVAGYFERRGEAAGIHPLYRLDRDTTGIIILAKSARIQHAMTKHHGQIYASTWHWCEAIWTVQAAASTCQSAVTRARRITGRCAPMAGAP